MRETTLDTAARIENFADNLKRSMLAGLAAGHSVTLTERIETRPVETPLGPDKLVSADTFAVRIALPESQCSPKKSA